MTDFPRLTDAQIRERAVRMFPIGRGRLNAGTDAFEVLQECLKRGEDLRHVLTCAFDGCETCADIRRVIMVPA